MSKMLTVKDVAELMQVKSLTVYRWVQDRKIPFAKLPGGTLRFDADKINNWIQLRTVKSKA